MSSRTLLGCVDRCLVRLIMSKSENTFRLNQIGIDTEPVVGSLKDLGLISLKLVSWTKLEPFWDYFVRRYHYLSYRRLLGHRLKYLAFAQGRPLAALSWSAAALKLGVRDRYIGWRYEQKKKHLSQVANNSRYLVFPWVRVPNLASHILSINIGHLKTDWPKFFGHRLLLLETFVDPRHFQGTCYPRW